MIFQDTTEKNLFMLLLKALIVIDITIHYLLLVFVFLDAFMYMLSF